MVTHTKILDMNGTLIPQPSVVDSSILRIGNQASITALGDSQTVDGTSSLRSKHIVQFLCGRIGGNQDLPG